MERGADFSGWGSKQGSKIKTWKKRFFVLRGRELVYYSSSSNGGSDEKGRLTVVGADFAPDLKNGLLIRGEKKNKTQVLKMKTATADESKAWLLTIRQAVAEVDPVAPHISASFRTRSVSNLSSNSSNASSRASSISNNNSSGFFGATPPLPPVPERSFASQRSLSVSNDSAPPPAVEYYRRGSSISSSPGDKRGWLLKEGRNVKSWKKRFFVLRGNVLTYYADEQSSPKLGSVIVHDVETNFTTPFTLDVHGAGSRLLRIAADSLDVIESWDLALAHAISTAGADDSGDAKTRAKSLSTARSSSSSFSTDAYDAFEQHGKVQYRLDHQGSSSLDDAYETAATAAVADTEPTPYYSQFDAASPPLPQPRPTGPVETCDGWLLKQGRQSKQWKRRFFTLTHDSLEYRHAPDDFPNEDERILDADLAALGDLAVLYIELDSGRTITVTAESPSELARWVDALSAVLGKALSIDNQLEDEQEQEVQGEQTPLTPRAPVVAAPLSPVSYEVTAPAPASPVAVVAAAPVATPVAAPIGIKYGWLLKQGSLIKSWKRRYFVLEGDVLTYYEHIDKAPRGSGVVARVVRDSGAERGLDVHLTSGRILKVASETASELEAWYAALSHASQLVSQTATLSSASSSVTTDTDAAHYVPTTLGQSGWLLKCGQNFKTWRLRYFVLERSRLLYYSSDDVANSEALGAGVVFDVSVGDARPLCINVRFQNGRLLQLAAPDEKLFTVWLRALETSSNLTSSFLSQHDASGDSRTSAPTFDNEFDRDVAEDGDSATAAPAPTGEEIEFDWERPRKSSSSGSDNQGDNDKDPKSGYAAWEAAMENKPEFDSSASWSSSDDEGNDDDAQSRRSATDKLTDALAPTSVAVTTPPLVAGWLNKEGGKVLKTWKRRYFSLHGTTLRSFKSESGSLLRTFTLAHVDECLALPLGLEVTTTLNRKLVLTAESKDDYARWLRGFQAALHVATSTPASPVATASVASASPSTKSKPPTAPSTPVAAAATVHATVAAPSTPMAAAAPSAPVAAPRSPVASTIPVAVDLGRVLTVNAEGKTVTAYSGWLEKEGQRFKTWKRRYFTYKRGALLYFSEIGGVAHGHGTVTGVRVDASKAFTLSIQLEGDRVLRVSAASADDMDTWLRVLTADCPLLSPVASASSASSPAASPSHKTPSTVTVGAPVAVAVAAATAVASAAASSEPTPASPAGRGAARERVSDRLDPSDYLANDTISNESFLRIQDEQFRRHGDSGAAAPPATGPFKGDLSFAARDADSVTTTSAGADAVNKGTEPDRAEKLQLVTERAESEEDLAYYRELLAENEREREKREAEKAAQVSGCAPCCVVM